MAHLHSRLTLEALEGAHGEIAQRIALELMEWAEQRAELLEALKQIARIPNKDIGSDWEEIEEARVIATDAITKAEAAE